MFVTEPTNTTGLTVFDNSLILKTTQLKIEEYVQDNPKLTLTQDIEEADIVVYSEFVEYERPDIGFNFGTLSLKKEKVFLTMKITFYEEKYNFRQHLITRQMLEKESRSNFYSMVETEYDFIDSMLFNLIKKTIDQAFVDYFNLLF